jgi:hypothetical protein
MRGLRTSVGGGSRLIFLGSRDDALIWSGMSEVLGSGMPMWFGPRHVVELQMFFWGIHM